jgi:ATP-dependent Lon protease
MGKHNLRNAAKDVAKDKLDSDNDSDDSFYSNSDTESESEGDLDQGPGATTTQNSEYQALLQTLFPSKYTIHDLKENSEDDDADDSSYYSESDSESESTSEIETKSNDSSENKCVHIKKTKRVSSKPKEKPESKIFNIFLPGSDGRHEDYSSDSEQEQGAAEHGLPEHEDDPLSSDDLKSPDAKGKEKSNKEAITKDKTKNETITKYLDMELSDEHFATLSADEASFWKQLDAFHIDKLDKSLATTDNAKPLRNNRILLDGCIAECKSLYYDEVMKRSVRVKKEKERNQRIYKHILTNNNSGGDAAYFNTLNSVQQNKLIKKMREIKNISSSSTPHRIQVLENDNIPLPIKAIAMAKIAELTGAEESEASKINYWINTFMKIPFGIYKDQPVSIEDGPDKCHEFMTNAQATLDAVTYGLNDAKMQILQYLGQLVSNPSSIGTSVAIHGPMGTGKTTLVREGISKILNRPFAFIALGGATDSSFLEGHSYTYVGSVIGKILQIIIESKCMNPVIYFDELDKISDTPRGEEITGILTHLTDTTQNSQFHDKYFSEFGFDLSKCLFIFSYNDESKINPILKDRMYNIRTQGYQRPEKTIISKLHLLPNICKQMNLQQTDIIIADEIIHYIVDHYCVKQYDMEEFGVRNLKRYLEVIYSKINLYRLVKPGTPMCGVDNVSFEITFPLTVTKKMVDTFIKNLKKNVMSEAAQSMYM